MDSPPLEQSRSWFERERVFDCSPGWDVIGRGGRRHGRDWQRAAPEKLWEEKAQLSRRMGIKMEKNSEAYGQI